MKYHDICAVCGKTYGEHKAVGDNCPKLPYRMAPVEFLETVFKALPQPATYSLTIDQIKGIFNEGFYCNPEMHKDGYDELHDTKLKQYLKTVLGINAGELK